MEVQIRRPRTAQIENQENVYANKGKANIVLPSKKQGLTMRILGELNTNVPLSQRDVHSGKVAGAAAEFEKKASQCRGTVKSSYSHVQSRVDTGLSAKSTIQPSSRRPLRREESTACLQATAKMVARSRAFLKETKKSTETKETAINIHIQPKKLESKKIESKKAGKLPETLKPILKGSTESLDKLEKLKIGGKGTTSKPSELQIDSPLNATLDTTPELPADIEDIDAGDHNPLIMSIYIKDIYRHLIHLEEKYPIESDHLKNQMDITGKMRATLIDWLVDVHHQFSLLLETFHLTVAIIDRYLQVVPNVRRSRLQLVGVTAMFIASKYEEIYAPDVADFVYVTSKAYTKADIFQCERDIMSKLGFCLGRPIPLSFLRRFVKAAHGDSKNHHLAKYLVDLSLVEYSMAHYRPSEVAAAAICLSLYLLSSKKLEDVWTQTLSYYSGYTLDQIQPIIRELARIVINVEKSRHQAVYKKYLDRSLAKVSSLPQLKSDVIYELAKTPTQSN